MTTETRSWRDATSNVAFAISLTAFMGSTLFVLVALNPKQENYDNLPWYYAAFCLVLSGAVYMLHRRIEAKTKQLIQAK